MTFIIGSQHCQFCPSHSLLVILVVTFFALKMVFHRQKQLAMLTDILFGMQQKWCIYTCYLFTQFFLFSCCFKYYRYNIHIKISCICVRISVLYLHVKLLGYELYMCSNLLGYPKLFSKVTIQVCHCPFLHHLLVLTDF